jgi:tetratricopeptide (TPR) repeat protein
MSDWVRRVDALCARASDAVADGKLDEALAATGEAFAIVDAEGTQQHPVFAQLLCAAGDAAVVSDELDSARSLYMRAHQVAAVSRADGAVTAKALVALGSILEADGEPARAAEHYRSAIEALDGSTHEDAELARAAIAEALARVR